MSQFKQTDMQMAQPSFNPQNWPKSIFPDNWLPVKKQTAWGNNPPDAKNKLPFMARRPIAFPLRGKGRGSFSGGLNSHQVQLGNWMDLNYAGRPIVVTMKNASVPNVGFIQYQELSGQTPAPQTSTSPSILWTFTIPQDKVGALVSVMTGITSLTFQTNYVFSLLYNSQDVLHGSSSGNNTGLVTPNGQWIEFGQEQSSWMRFLSGTVITFKVRALNNVITNDQVSGSILLALFPKE